MNYLNTFKQSRLTKPGLSTSIKIETKAAQQAIKDDNSAKQAIIDSRETSYSEQVEPTKIEAQSANVKVKKQKEK